MSEMLLWLSGVDRDVLSHCERERNKFVAMGGTVLTTASLAFLAATFTIHEFLHAPLVFALLLGVGWAFAIMNLDRWLLISIRRQDTPGKTIAMAVPRVVLALLIGAVIAHPLVLRVFEKEIGNQATIDKNEALADGKADLRTQFAAIGELEDEADAIQDSLTDVRNGAGVQGAPEYKAAAAELQRLQKREARAQKEALCELDATCGTGKQGAGSVYEAKQSVADSLHDQVVAQEQKVAAIRDRLSERETKQAGQSRRFQQRELRNIERKASLLVAEQKRLRRQLVKEHGEKIGLLDRVVALDNLTFARPEMLAIEILLFLFILAIDTMPAIAKVLMSLGKPSLYETTQLELEEADGVALRDQTRAHGEASKIDAELVVDEARTRHDLMKEVQDDLVRQAADAMREAGEKFVALWREEIVKRVPRMVRGEMERTGVVRRQRRDPEARPSGDPEGPASNKGSNGAGTRDPQG